MADDEIPAEVLQLLERPPRVPVESPTLGIGGVDVPPGAAANRLVTIGDSLTHGFRSLAVFDTDTAYPVLIARALGIEDEFRHPRYDEEGACGGLPLSLEWLLRELQHATGERIDALELPELLWHANRVLNRHEAYWEHVPRDTPPRINHNLAMYGFTVGDAMTRTARGYKDAIEARPPHDDPLFPAFPDDGEAIAALRVLDSPDDGLTQLTAAKRLAADGIETLIVFLGANNALNTVVSLKAVWSKDGRDGEWDPAQPCNIWLPRHFRTQLDALAGQVRDVGAEHVL
jgi:hypothetical protein